VPFQLFSENEESFSAFFYNPNIQPAEEYERRLTCLRSFAHDRGVELKEGAYDPEAWDTAIGECAGIVPLIKDDPSYEENLALRKARCRACYALRFERLAACAVQHGFSSIATTLSISPYQFTDIMADELLAAAKREGVLSGFVDYHKRYPVSVKRAREFGLYRQNYCGCRYSKTEAEQERAARKIARKATQKAAQKHSHAPTQNRAARKTAQTRAASPVDSSSVNTAEAQ
jgi:predicted adenine nucleotide alpha hydrolase (AANH) superfamily ATPase